MEEAWQETSREMNHRGFTQEQIAKAMVQPNELKRVHTTVAPIEHQGKGFTLVGANPLTILRFLRAFLLRNGLSQHRLRFYVDGQRTLQDGILTFFSWYRSTDGSLALSALAYVVLNNRTKEWLTESQFSLTFNTAA